MSAGRLRHASQPAAGGHSRFAVIVPQLHLLVLTPPFSRAPMARYARLLLVTLAVVAERSSGDKDPCMTNVFRVGSGAPVGLPTPAPAAVLDRRPIIERLGGHGLPTAALSLVALTLIVAMMMMPSGGQHHSGT